MIDIIIPVYNSLNVLEKALESVSKQTVKDRMNVIIVDDASQEDYTAILLKYKHLNIKYIKQKQNQGAGVTRQIGIDNSTGKYLLFLDSDDFFFADDSVKLLYDKIEQGYDYVDSFVYYEQKKKDGSNDSDLHGKIYRRKFIEEKRIIFNQSRYHEDNSFNNIVLLNHPARATLYEITYIYCNNSLSLTNAKQDTDLEFIESYIYNMKYVLDSVGDKNCSPNLVEKYLEVKYNYLNALASNLCKEKKEKLNYFLAIYGFEKI